jgi:hypothetical protein
MFHIVYHVGVDYCRFIIPVTGNFLRLPDIDVSC